MSKKSKQYKMLVLDVDKSMSTLGSPERQAEVLGVQPIPIYQGLEQVSDYLNKLLMVERVPKEHPIMGVVGEEIKLKFNEKGQEHGVNMLGIDSITVLGSNEREIIRKKEGIVVMDQRSWGIYGDEMIKFINKLNKCDFPVVVTAHIKRDQDENGSPIEIADLKGSAATAMGRYFDVIAYSKIDSDAQGKAKSFNWTVTADRRRIMAKNRGNVIESNTIPQNLRIILDAYAQSGNHAPKILILADSGGGKTWSLQTINNTPEVTKTPTINQ